MSKNKLVRKMFLGGLPTQSSRISSDSYKNPPFFKESQALKEKSQNSRNSRPWKKNPNIQGIPGLDEKSQNSKNPRPWKKNPQYQGITGLERKIPKFKESQALKEKSPNSRNSRFSRWRTTTSKRPHSTIWNQSSNRLHWLWCRTVLRILFDSQGYAHIEVSHCIQNSQRLAHGDKRLRRNGSCEALTKRGRLEWKETKLLQY